MEEDEQDREEERGEDTDDGERLGASGDRKDRLRGLMGRGY